MTENRRVVPLLAVDEELGRLLPPERLAMARADLLVRALSLPVGEWDTGRLDAADPSHLGLLVTEGILAREVVMADTVSTELLGPGDVVRPWHLEESAELLRNAVRWQVLAPATLALLDRRGGRPPPGPPPPRGRPPAPPPPPAGLLPPMPLPPGRLGQLGGPRRPTVSTALAELAETGQLERRDDGSWLIRGQPVGVPVEHVEEVIPLRRRFVSAQADEESDAMAAGLQLEAATHTAPRFSELRATLDELRETSDRQAEELRMVTTAAVAPDQR